MKNKLFRLLMAFSFVAVMSFKAFAGNSSSSIEEINLTIGYDATAQPGEFKVTSDNPDCLIESVDYDRNQNILDIFLKASYSHVFGISKMSQIHYNMQDVTMTSASRMNGSPSNLHVRFCPTSGAWGEDETGKYFMRYDGSRVNSGWYYVPDGSCEVEGESPHKVNCYYFGEDGYILRNTTTPDGYAVDENGVWKKN